MKCNEVGELMQRKIDLDLLDAEALQLELHLADCKTCQNVFAHLNLLSDHLEQLPQVTPPFSIVDSILPKLAEIDMQQEEGIIKKLEDSASFALEGTSKPKAAFFRRWTFVSVTSVVAAAAIILLTINLTGQKDENFSVANVAVHQDTDTVSSQDTAQSKRFVAEVNNQSTGEVEVAPTYTTVSSTNEATTKQVDQFKTSANSNKEEEVSNNVTENEPPLDRGTNDEYGIMKITNNGTPDNSINEQAEQESSIMGMGHLDNKYISPDERFYLAIDSNKIMVHDLATDELLKEIEVPIEGEISFVGWHETGVEFYIDVVDAEQQTHNITLPLGL